jgi:pSer/pThr/pTyr-binding forkhead associated (FHA) protein/V8-like Glu-specific endopeptidase
MNHRNLNFLRVVPFSFLMLLCLLSGNVRSQQPNASNRLYMFSKPAVVRIISGHVGTWSWDNRQWETQSISSGSGFIISQDGYVMTNAHVVSSIKDGDDEARNELLGQLAVQALRAAGKPVNRETVVQAAQIIMNTGAQLSKFQRINYVFLQSGSRYPYEIKAYGAPTGEGKDLLTGKDVAVIKIEVKNAPTLRIGNSDKMQVGDKIFVMGYPGAADSEVLDAKSQLEPTTNDGSISAKKTSADGAPILQTNANTTHGNSGGPVINEQGEVVGLLTFRGNTVNGQEVQGFNFIVPSLTAQEFVRQAGTENRLSPVDTKWREGLENFWNKEYSFASTKFQEILALFPDHSESRRLITESQERIAKGEDMSGAGLGAVLLLVIFGGGFLLIGGGAILVFVLLRKKKSPAPAQAAFSSPHGAVQVMPPMPQPASQPPPSWPPPSPAPQPQYQQAAPQAMQPGVPARTEMFQPTVTFTAGPLQGQSFPIGQGLFIGRDAARAQIVVSDPQVSGQHLWIGMVNGRIIARDSGSTNGTYLNQQMMQRITEVTLNNRDTLTLGRTGTVMLMFQA